MEDMAGDSEAVAGGAEVVDSEAAVVEAAAEDLAGRLLRTSTRLTKMFNLLQLLGTSTGM